MSEDEIARKLSLFHDGELDPAEASVIEMKIATDEEWRQKHEAMKKTSAVMRGFFDHETADAAGDPATKKDAVDRIIRESTAVLVRQRRSSGFFGNLWRDHRALLILGLIALLPTGYLVWPSLFSGAESDARRKIESSGKALEHGHHQIQVDFSGAQGLILGPLFATGRIPDRCTIETGPDGRFHLRIPTPQSTTYHFGYNGREYWEWSTDRSEVRVFSTAEKAETDIGRAVQSAWKKIAESIRRAADVGEELKVIGRERIEDGAEEWTKVDATLKGILAGRGQLWLDKDGNVRRVMARGIKIDMAQRPLQSSDYEWKTWAPDADAKELR